MLKRTTNNEQQRLHTTKARARARVIISICNNEQANNKAAKVMQSDSKWTKPKNNNEE